MSVLDAINATKGGFSTSTSGTSPLTTNLSTGTSSSLSSAAAATKGSPSATVAGTSTPWHQVVLWFLGAIAMLALADPAPQIATMLVLLIILGTLLNNWSIYKSYLGLK